MMSTDFPRTSPALYPKIRSAARFQRVTMPSKVLAIIASLAESHISDSSAFSIDGVFLFPDMSIPYSKKRTLSRRRFASPGLSSTKTASVQSHQPGRRTFFGDLQIPTDAFIADHVLIRTAGGAFCQQREVDFGPVPVSVVGKDDIRSNRPDDVAEPLCRPDVILKRFTIRIEAGPTPQSQEVRGAVIFHRNQKRDRTGSMTRRDVQRQRRVADCGFLAVGGHHVALWFGAIASIQHIPVPCGHDDARAVSILQELCAAVVIGVSMSDDGVFDIGRVET